jgi:hypothetical protein
VGLAVGLGEFVLPVFLGNTAGGVILVTVVDYYQTSEHRLGQIGGSKRISRLTIQEWLFGRWVGRSYVPLLDTHEGSTTSTGEGERILVPISNPRTEGGLVELAYTYASQQENASVHLVHIVQQPDNMRMQMNATGRERIIRESEGQLNRFRTQARTFDIEPEISTVVTHDAFEEITARDSLRTGRVVVGHWFVVGREEGSVCLTLGFDEVIPLGKSCHPYFFSFRLINVKSVILIAVKRSPENSRAASTPV